MAHLGRPRQSKQLEAFDQETQVMLRPPVSERPPESQHGAYGASPSGPPSTVRGWSAPTTTRSSAPPPVWQQVERMIASPRSLLATPISGMTKGFLIGASLILLAHFAGFRIHLGSSPETEAAATAMPRPAVTALAAAPPAVAVELPPARVSPPVEAPPAVAATAAPAPASASDSVSAARPAAFPPPAAPVVRVATPPAHIRAADAAPPAPPAPAVSKPRKKSDRQVLEELQEQQLLR